MLLMNLYLKFNIYIRCFLLEKNATMDGISKTYLEYLYMRFSEGDDEHNFEMFDALIKMCLRREELIIKYEYKNGKPIFIIDEETYNSKDFDEIRLLICEQNDIEIPDETVQKEIRDSIDESKRIRAKLSGIIPPTLEDQVVCVMASTSLRLEDIANMSIRKFGQLLQRIDTKLHYQVYLTASMSGLVQIKDKNALKHWMSGIESNKWTDNTISMETLMGKLGDAAQNNKK
jgi:hypothetical protein